MATSNVLVVKEDAPDDASTSLPNTSNIRRSLSPILDFGTRRNFCNIVECAYCRSHAEDHRLSPIRSPMKSPSSRFFFTLFFIFSCTLYLSGNFVPFKQYYICICIYYIYSTYVYYYIYSTYVILIRFSISCQLMRSSLIF